MNFGEALQALKDGKRVQRSGWNGKGMWLMLVKAHDYAVGQIGIEMMTGHPQLKTEGGLRALGYFDLLPWIGMKTADNKFVPWLASQTDILAEDWSVVS